MLVETEQKRAVHLVDEQRGSRAIASPAYRRWPARAYANSENHTLRRQGAGRPTTEPVAAE